MDHPSNSGIQKEAEPEMLRIFCNAEGVTMAQAILPLGGASVTIDGYNQEAKLLCEIYTHIGTTKGAQPHKVANDILKLITVDEDRGGGHQKILIFGDGQASACVRGRRWLAEVVKRHGIRIVDDLHLPPDLRENILATQRKQIMVSGWREDQE